jgi:DNA replication protein DnaC
MKEVKPLNQLMDKSQPLPPEPSEEILTPEEIEAALEAAKPEVLRMAREEKKAKLAIIEYNRKIKEQSEAYVSADQFMDWILRKAVKTIKNFAVSEREEQIYKNLALYFTQDKRCPLDLRKGLWLFGGVGCGKTTIMELFSENPLMNYPVVQTSLIADEYKENGGKNLQRFYDVPSVCFNDFGFEIEEGSKSHFGNKKNVMAEIIQNSYEFNKEKKFRLHFTTNLNADQVEQYYGPRVRSRLREMCNIISLEGINDKRK